MQQAYSLLQIGEAVVLLRTCRELNNSKLEDEKDYKLVLRLLCVFRICMCVRTYHVRNNYVT